MYNTITGNKRSSRKDKKIPIKVGSILVGTNSKKQVHILKYLGVGTNELLQVTTMKKRSTDIKIRQLCIFSIMKISDCQIVVLDPNQQSTRIGGGGK